MHPRQHFYKVPDDVDDAVAASANCALSQVMFGIDQIGLGYGETVLIQGAGGLGLNAAAVAVERGARIIVVDGVAARLEQAKSFGADDTIDMAILPTRGTPRRVQRLIGGEGPDVGIELPACPTPSPGARHHPARRPLPGHGQPFPGSTVPSTPDTSPAKR